MRGALAGRRRNLLSSPADPITAAGPDVPPPAKEKTPNRRGYLRLTGTAMAYILALILAQLGAESVGAALPTLIQKTFGDFATTVTHLAILTYVTDFLGRQIAPLTIKKLGLKKTFLLAHGMKLLAIGSLAGLLATGHITLPLLQLFILANAFLGGITSTTENSIPPALVGRDAAALEHYWTREQAFRQLMSIGGPIATGAVVFSFGFLPAFLAFPIATAFTLWIVWKMVNISRLQEKTPAGEKSAARTPGSRPEAEGAPASSLKERARKSLEPFTRGALLVWGNPALRASAAAFAFFAATGALLFVLMAPAYGLLLAGPGMEELATGISGWVIGLFNLGGLLGVLGAIRSQRGLARRIEDEKPTKAAVDKLMLGSLLRWMLWGALALASMATFALPLPVLGSLLPLPGALAWAGNIGVPALALIPLGFVLVVTIMKLRSFFQSRVPDLGDMPDAMGFLGAFTLLIQAASLFVLKHFFTWSTGYTPFLYIALSLIPLAGIFLLLRNLIKKYGGPVIDRGLPEPSLGRLRTLTDENGIFEHATRSGPNKAHGYCAEDAARALVAALMFNRDARPGDESAAALAGVYMRYLERSQTKDGSFHHRMDARGRLSEQTATEDAYGRVLWGLGFALAHPDSPRTQRLAKRLFDRALAGGKKLAWPRAKSYAVLGLHYYLKRFPGATAARAALESLADDLAGMYKSNASGGWRWFDDELTYDNAKLPQALLLAYETTGKKAYLDAALESLDFLIRVNFPTGDMLQVVGNKGWYHRGGKPAIYDQQPTDAASMVEVLAAAFRLTGVKRYRDLAQVAYAWFLGRNAAGKPLYDPATGGSRDGLNEDKINPNQGAESSIMALIALLTARRLPG